MENQEEQTNQKRNNGQDKHMINNFSDTGYTGSAAHVQTKTWQRVHNTDLSIQTFPHLIYLISACQVVFWLVWLFVKPEWQRIKAGV